MGHLSELVKLNLLVYGGEVDSFKNNSILLTDMYNKSDDMVKLVYKQGGGISDFVNGSGSFLFMRYNTVEKNNWMNLAPILLVSKGSDVVSKVSGLNGVMVIFYAINLNFIPLEIRVMIFDPFLKESNFDKNIPMKVDYESVYNELFKYGYEYALMEWDFSKVLSLHKIHMSMLPKFLYSQHTLVKYDPKKLYEINNSKIKDQIKRDNEMKKATLSDFFDSRNEISGKYDILKNHIKRLSK